MTRFQNSLSTDISVLDGLVSDKHTRKVEFLFNQSYTSWCITVPNLPDQLKPNLSRVASPPVTALPPRPTGSIAMPVIKEVSPLTVDIKELLLCVVAFQLMLMVLVTVLPATFHTAPHSTMVLPTALPMAPHPALFMTGQHIRILPKPALVTATTPTRRLFTPDNNIVRSSHSGTL